MGTKLDEFFSSLATLPGEVVRSLELMRSLDHKVQGLVTEMGTLLCKCTDNSLTTMEKKYFQALLTARQKEALACSKEKICIVQQVSDMLKACITSLDQELALISKDINPALQPAFVRPEESLEVTTDLQPEPTSRAYCICQRPSQGLMVACDNPNVRSMQCPYEWFHFECVGLQTQPTGQWFCAHCT